MVCPAAGCQPLAEIPRGGSLLQNSRAGLHRPAPLPPLKMLGTLSTMACFPVMKAPFGREISLESQGGESWPWSQAAGGRVHRAAAAAASTDEEKRRQRPRHALASGRECPQASPAVGGEASRRMTTPLPRGVSKSQAVGVQTGSRNCSRRLPHLTGNCCINRASSTPLALFESLLDYRRTTTRSRSSTEYACANHSWTTPGKVQLLLPPRRRSTLPQSKPKLGHL